MSESVPAIFLDFSARKLQQLSERIESCLGELSEEQVWARGSENENAIGNLALHLCGNVRQWVVSGVGGRPDIRDRDAEFAARGGLSRTELARRLRETVVDAAQTLSELPPGRLGERVTIQGYNLSVTEAIYHVVEHFSMHAGQIIFATKALTSGDPGFYSHLRSGAPHGGKTP
jgi:uncharacterized damage-inducible protein DinB